MDFKLENVLGSFFRKHHHSQRINDCSKWLKDFPVNSLLSPEAEYCRTEAFQPGKASMKSRVLTRVTRVLFTKTHVAIVSMAQDNAAENYYYKLPLQGELTGKMLQFDTNDS